MEYKLQDAIIAYLKGRKVWHFRYTASTTFGIPDILALYKGHFIGIEVKREDGKGRATLLQEEMIKSIQRNGGLARVVDNLEDVDKLFISLDNLTDYSSIEYIHDNWQIHT